MVANDNADLHAREMELAIAHMLLLIEKNERKDFPDAILSIAYIAELQGRDAESVIDLLAQNGIHSEELNMWLEKWFALQLAKGDDDIQPPDGE